MDKLEHMFEMQAKLNDNVIERKAIKHYDQTKETGHVSEIEQREWCDNYMSALQSEVVEVREALTQRVKWWSDKTKDREGVLDELSDCMHFLMSGALAMGFTAEDFYQMYLKKNEANFSRQDWDVNRIEAQ